MPEESSWLVIEGQDEEGMHAIQRELAAAIEAAGVGESFRADPVVSRPAPESEKGDPVTLLNLALVAVGAGGALTVAVSKGGFLTQLARVLEKRIESGQVRVTVVETAKTRKVEVAGPARKIEKVLTSALELLATTLRQRSD